MSKTVAFSKHSVNVFFHILTRCNLRCSHCYINPEQHGSETLPFETISAWLNLFVSKTRDANLILLGGEPTLHPDLARIIKAARAMGYGSITVDTNGYLFHDILNKIAPKDLDFISFSLDGATPATNDAIRGNGCYENCVSGIRQAVKKGFKASLIYTVSNENIHELQMMPPLLERLNVNRFFIQVIGIRGKSRKKIEDSVKKNQKLQVDRDTWMTLIPKVADMVADMGITVTYPKVFLDTTETFECAGNVADNYFIFPNGRVYRCPLCEDYPLHSFEITNNQLIPKDKINEQDLFALTIPEGCVINRLVQPANLNYRNDGTPEYKIACCLLKKEVAAIN
jgi:MoaA/NifB/PqqE/SkfB family radical SAM enzyme